MPYIQVNGTELYYELHGLQDGELVWMMRSHLNMPPQQHAWNKLSLEILTGSASKKWVDRWTQILQAVFEDKYLD